MAESAWKTICCQNRALRKRFKHAQILTQAIVKDQHEALDHLFKTLQHEVQTPNNTLDMVFYKCRDIGHGSQCRHHRSHSKTSMQKLHSMQFRYDRKPRFFVRCGFFVDGDWCVHTQDIAALLGGELICANNIDAQTYDIARVVAPDALRPHAIAVIFHVGTALPKDYQGCLVADAAHDVPQDAAAIVVPQPRLAFAKLLETLHPVSSPQPGIHQTAVIAADATIDPSATIGPNVVIGAQAVIGPHCVVSAGCFVGDGVTIGAETRLQPHVVIDAAATVGTHCLIHAGVVIGADGFGFTQCANTHAWQKIPHIGSVCIGNHGDWGQYHH